MLRRLPRLMLYTAVLLAAFAFVTRQEAPVQAQTTPSLPASASMPFAGEKAYTGGPHTGGICSTQAVNQASGIDFSGSFEVLAIAEGVFKGTTQMNPGLETKMGQGPLSAGNVVIIEHDATTKLQSQYWHLESFSPGIEQLVPHHTHSAG